MRKYCNVMNRANHYNQPIKSNHFIVSCRLQKLHLVQIYEPKSTNIWPRLRISFKIILYMPPGAALRLSPNGAQYVTFQKRFLIFKFGFSFFLSFFLSFFFATPSLKQKLGLQINGRLLINSKPLGPIITIGQS